MTEAETQQEVLKRILKREDFFFFFIEERIKYVVKYLWTSSLYIASLTRRQKIRKGANTQQKKNCLFEIEIKLPHIVQEIK
jgi:hypothetical protein